MTGFEPAISTLARWRTKPTVLHPHVLSSPLKWSCCLCRSWSYHCRSCSSLRCRSSAGAGSRWPSCRPRCSSTYCRCCSRAAHGAGTGDRIQTLVLLGVGVTWRQTSYSGVGKDNGLLAIFSLMPAVRLLLEGAHLFHRVILPDQGCLNPRMSGASGTGGTEPAVAIPPGFDGEPESGIEPEASSLPRKRSDLLSYTGIAYRSRDSNPNCFPFEENVSCQLDYSGKWLGDRCRPHLPVNSGGIYWRHRDLVDISRVSPSSLSVYLVPVAGSRIDVASATTGWSISKLRVQESNLWAPRPKRGHGTNAVPRKGDPAE